MAVFSAGAAAANDDPLTRTVEEIFLGTSAV
jgi:hypothetical protein